MKTGYADIYYIFGILSGAKQPICRERLRRKVSCRGSKFTELFKMLQDKGYIDRVHIPTNSFMITCAGRSLLSTWQTILLSLDLADELSRFL
jgi:predicted transcriptional regulator